MPNPTELHEIDEFADVLSVSDLAITDEIIASVRQLNEESELERFLQEILFDPNKTPHGPTEIADILSTHLHVRGTRRLAAFVLKGRSWQKVRSRDVTHQFAKLRQIEGLGLMVFVAVGHVQDDATRNFVQSATDAGCDYVIVDAHDLARLLIAYDKICPQDGTPFNDEGVCRKGHALDEGITLNMQVREEATVTVLGQRDVSHAGAKRYSVNLLLDKHYSRDVIRKVIVDMTEEMRSSRYYRNERVRDHFGNQLAHVVWLHIAADLEDAKNANWICQTSWIDPSLPEEMRPMPMKAHEVVDGIAIQWNENYTAHKKMLSPAHRARKEDVVDPNVRIWRELAAMAERVISLFGKYESKQITEIDLVEGMQEMEPRATGCYLESGNIPFGPPDCHDFAQRCQELFGTIHDMFLYYSERGLKTWPRKNRDYLMRTTINRYYQDLGNVEYEHRKLH